MATPRQHFDALCEPDFDIQYRSCTTNNNADGLSRQAWPDDDTLGKEREVLGMVGTTTVLPNKTETEEHSYP